MDLQTVQLPTLPTPVLDVDIASDGRVAILCGDGTRCSVYIDGRERATGISMEADRIRLIRDDTYLLTGFRSGLYGAAVYRSPGDLEAAWEMDSDVEDVCIVGDWAVVGFGDISTKGVLAHALNGSSMAYYDDVFAEAAVETFDCYALCQDTSHAVYFFPYAGFPLVRWDLVAMTQEIHPTPEPVAGADAISIAGDDCYFFNPYEHNGAVLQWTIGDTEVRQIGTFPATRGRIRGLPGGRFLVVESESYTVLRL